MKTAQIIQLDDYRHSTPAQRLSADRPRIIKSFVDAVDKKEMIKTLMADSFPTVQPDPIIVELNEYIERAATRRYKQLVGRITALEKQLAQKGAGI